MRVAVLPREVAARVITSGVARGAWAISAVSLTLTIPMLSEFAIERDAAAAVPIPVAILLVMIALAVLGAVRPRPVIAALFLLVGAAGAVLYQVMLVSAVPEIIDEGYFLLNRPAVSLVLVGVEASSTLIGLSWTLVGYLISYGVSFTVAGVTVDVVRTGWGPTLMLLLYVTAYVALGAIQSRQRQLVPDFEQLEEETRRLALEENLRARMTAAMHDTLLNDLSLVMNAPDELDERAIERLREDVAKLTSPEWRTTASEAAVLDNADGELRNRIMRLISDLQWRGLTVRVTGGGSDIYRLAPEVADAMVDAVRACLENVLRHSGTTVAELDLAYDESSVTVVVSDQGAGFDRSAVPADRLGLAGSIEGRVRAVGGTAKVWSTPGTGTSVVLTVPIIEMVSSHEEPNRGE